MSLPGFWLVRLLGRAVLGVALTTLIAGLATAPFAAYHFERVATYSLLGNLLAAPLVSAIIMPFGLLTLVVMPLGLEALPLAVMAWGIEMLLARLRLGRRRCPARRSRRRRSRRASLLLIAGGHALALPLAAALAAARHAGDRRSGLLLDPGPRRSARHPGRAGRQGGRRARCERRAPRLRRARRFLRRRAVLRRGGRPAAGWRRRSARACAATRSPACSPAPDGVDGRARRSTRPPSPRTAGAPTIVVTPLAAPADCRGGAGHRRAAARSASVRMRCGSSGDGGAPRFDVDDGALRAFRGRGRPAASRRRAASAQYFRSSPVSRPWMRMRSGPKMRVS